MKSSIRRPNSQSPLLKRIPWFPKWELVEWVVETYFNTNQFSDPIVFGAIETLYQRQLAFYASRPPLFSADYTKEARLAVTRYILGMNRLARPCFRCTRSGLPKIIPTILRDKIRSGDKNIIRLVLTMLSVTRGIKGGKPVDVGPMTTPTTSVGVDNLPQYIQSFAKSWSISPFQWSFRKFHYTGKMGPNGPALSSALVDLESLSSQQLEDISDLGGPNLQEIIDFWRPWIGTSTGRSMSDQLCSRPAVLKASKLSVKADSEGKSRVFAILDYWTQSSLKGLHSKLFSILRGIPMDKTFNQTKGLKDLTPEEGHHYNSIDLSSATDRFPISIQVELLSFLIGRDKAERWKRLLTDRDFMLDTQAIRYQCGQPMGAYSSWATFALSHHLIVYIAGLRSGHVQFRNYCLLGDDIVICDDDVTDQYLLILKDLGVEYSPHKTFKSKVGFEFAKRIIIRKEEYSPISLPGLKEVSSNFSLLSEFLNQLIDRDYDSELLHRNPDLVSQLYKRLGLPSRLSAYYARKVFVLMHLPEKGQDPELVGDFFKKVSQWFGVSWSCNLSLSSVALAASRCMSEVIAEVLRQITTRARSESEAYKLLVDNFLAYDRVHCSRYGSVDHSRLRYADWTKYIPVVGTLSHLFSEDDPMYQDMEDFIDYVDLDMYNYLDVWGEFENAIITQMPPTTRFVPDRASQRIQKTKGDLVSRLFLYIVKRDLGSVT